MTFGEKIRGRRGELNLTQDELAQKIGVSRRVITSYENDRSRPRGTEGYRRAAEALKVNINYLLSEDDEFINEAERRYGAHGARQAKGLVSEISGLFSGGDITEEDKDEMMRAIQDAYWIAKEKNKKFAPKKYSAKE